jgi:hypothetical protein
MPGSKAVKERIELLIAQAPSGVTAILDARVGAGFKVDLVKPNRPPGEKCLCPPPRRYPRRRRGGILAPDGGG